MQRVASIDVGTNTILLLIADVDNGNLAPVLELETIVRLGEGIQKTGILSQDAMRRGIETLGQYLEHCRKMGAQKIFAVGTSALREARNSKVFLERVEASLGISIEVISGEEEAELSFLSVARDLKEPERPILVVDVGGGSTEFIFGEGDRILGWKSLPLGSARLTEQFLKADTVPEEDWKRMAAEIRSRLDLVPRPRGTFSMAAVGGTATTLASVEQGLEEFIFEKIHHFILAKEALHRQLLLYRSRTIEQRKQIKGLPPGRAEVILAGGAIFYAAMEVLDCPSLLVSCHGVRYGLLYKRLRSN